MVSKKTSLMDVMNKEEPHDILSQQGLDYLISQYESLNF